MLQGGMMIPTGELAYQRYCKASKGKSLISGDQLPHWETLPEKIKQAWDFSTKCVVETTVNHIIENLNREKKHLHGITTNNIFCSQPGCDGIMRPSKAIQETLVSGLPDFPGDETGITLSAGGPGKLIDCIKCNTCGHSKTTPKESIDDYLDLIGFAIEELCPLCGKRLYQNNTGEKWCSGNTCTYGNEDFQELFKSNSLFKQENK